MTLDQLIDSPPMRYQQMSREEYAAFVRLMLIDLDNIGGHAARWALAVLNHLPAPQAAGGAGAAGASRPALLENGERVAAGRGRK